MSLRARRSVVALLLAVLTFLASLVAPTATVQAQGGWLDPDTPSNWNAVGMAVPAAPPRMDPGMQMDSRCGRDERPVETAEDEAVAAQGWRLFREYRAGWGVTVLMALSDYDGMCRPSGYQVFVFHEGRFAGTLSPDAMLARADGSLSEYNVLSPEPGDNTLGATFNRYSDMDPLCCPSRQARVAYRLDRGGAGPVLVPVRTETTSTMP